MPDRFIKLVRDKVGDDRDEVVYKRATFTNDDFHWALKRKLIEEAIEYLEDGSWEELIDVFEVVRALIHLDQHGGKTIFDMQVDAERRRLERGSFLNRVAMWIRRPS